MRLILTRHGETEENIAGILQGQLPGHLSARGIQQAIRLAERLQSEPIDIIYSSDLQRALDTSAQILKLNPDLKMLSVKNLRERHLGEYQGKKKRDRGLDLHGQAGAFLNPQEGESKAEVFARAINFIKHLQENHSDDTVLCVSHGTFLKNLIAAILEKSLEQVGAVEKLSNTSITIFNLYPDNKPEVLLYNCTQHCNSL